MTHLESHRAMTVDARTTYATISRARHHAAIYTDSREKLADAIELRSGERQTALELSNRMASVRSGHTGRARPLQL